MSKTERLLDDYLDRSFIYSVLLNQAHFYYGRLKTLFKIPLILMSSVMSVVNGNIENSESLKIVNITFNLLTAIILGLTATLNIEQKYQNFLQCERKFLKLSSKIEQKLLNENDEIHPEFINEIMNEYDMIVESVDYDIPVSICKRVRAQYATKKTLPLIINGVKKNEQERSPRISTFDGEKNIFSSPTLKNTVIPPQLPKVLTIKPLEIVVEGLQE